VELQSQLIADVAEGRTMIQSEAEEEEESGGGGEEEEKQNLSQQLKEQLCRHLYAPGRVISYRRALRPSASPRSSWGRRIDDIPMLWTLLKPATTSSSLPRRQVEAALPIFQYAGFQAGCIGHSFS
jgi:hypothetical protein